MNDNLTNPPFSSERGTRVAILFALVAERLATYYEHAQWLTLAQGATLTADWLSRHKQQWPIAERRHLSALSDTLARTIADSLSREAGLLTAHEMMESLSSNHLSDVSQSIMAECERTLAT